MLLVLGGVIVVIVIYSLIVPSSGGGVSALDRFLGAAGVQVRNGDLPPNGGTFVLLIDRRTSEEEASLLSWVDSGGRLVVVDPTSSLFARFGVTQSRAGVFGTTSLDVGCVRPETLGVATLDIAATDQLLSSPTTRAAVCGVKGTGAYVMFLPRGNGEIVLLGGASFLDDALLDSADNAVFAHGLLDAGGPVVFGPALPPDAARQGLWALIPTSAKSVLWELVIATIVFAFARGRRLGRPVPEEPISRIPSGELVYATARLYHLSGARAFCAAIIRRTTTDRIARRFGLPRDADDQQQVEAVLLRIGDPDPAVSARLHGPTPTTDQEFVALCRELEGLAGQIEGAER